MHYKCWCCSVVDAQSWSQVCEVSFEGTEDSCFECFNAINALHERHIVKYSVVRLLGVIKRMYAQECELTEDLVREKIRRLREVEDDESGSDEESDDDESGSEEESSAEETTESPSRSPKGKKGGPQNWGEYLIFSKQRRVVSLSRSSNCVILFFQE